MSNAKSIKAPDNILRLASENYFRQTVPGWLVMPINKRKELLTTFMAGASAALNVVYESAGQPDGQRNLVGIRAELNTFADDVDAGKFDG